MYISPTERMKVIHLWMGNTALDEKTYYEYFEQEEKISHFGRNIGLDEEYDEDMIGILPIFEKPVTVQEVLQKKVPIDISSISAAIKAAGQAGINTVNAVFYITDSSITVKEPHQADYNGLSYIGAFKSAL
ncbi:immunity 22 family protein [Pedobacter miscanthi]|nr:immunity 22 family protein [Pedobacter miscanthi]